MYDIGLGEIDVVSLYTIGLGGNWCYFRCPMPLHSFLFIWILIDCAYSSNKRVMLIHFMMNTSPNCIIFSYKMENYKKRGLDGLFPTHTTYMETVVMIFFITSYKHFWITMLGCLFQANPIA